MISNDQIGSLFGLTMNGQDGSKIGKIVDVYESTDGGHEGTFVTVHTGMFGGQASFVPLNEASMKGEDVVVPYDKDLVKDAPRVTDDEELVAEEENRLYQHYQLQAPTAPTGKGAGHDTSGPNTDDAMTRSEEQLHVGVERTEAGRARLRKRIVTEQQTRTVPVSHDELTVTREPITDANRGEALDGPAISEEEHEIVLGAERAVVAKETVPVERVRVGTEQVTEEQTVNETVRKEQIELDENARQDKGFRR